MAINIRHSAMKFTACIFVYLLTFSEASFASDPLSAGELLSFCKSSDPIAHKFCGVYILGIREGIGLSTEWAKEGNKFCIPDIALTTEQLVNIFQNTADLLRKNYPADMELTATGIVGASLATTFPCKK